MEKSQAIIKQIKEAKQKNKIPYHKIMEELTENGVPAISMTTLRRVCANGSESRASSFSYEGTLLPIAEAVKRIDEGNDDSPKEVKDLKTVICYLADQISEKDALISRLIDRLDQKDEIIRQFIADLKQKDSIIQKAMEKLM